MQTPKPIEGKFAGKRFSHSFNRDLVDDVFGKFETLTDNQLRAIIKRCNWLSKTNCGWNEYWMKDLIVKISQDKLKQKQAIRRAEKQKHET